MSTCRAFTFISKRAALWLAESPAEQKHREEGKTQLMDGDERNKTQELHRFVLTGGHMMPLVRYWNPSYSLVVRDLMDPSTSWSTSSCSCSSVRFMWKRSFSARMVLEPWKQGSWEPRGQKGRVWGQHQGGTVGRPWTKFPLSST